MNANPEFDSLVPAPSFDRRNFLVTSLGAGFALAVQPVMAQTAVVTDDTGLLAGEVKVPVKDGEMLAYRAVPKGVSKPRWCWWSPRYSVSMNTSAMSAGASRILATAQWLPSSSRIWATLVRCRVFPIFWRKSSTRRPMRR